MENIYFNKRLNSIAQRILAIPKAKRALLLQEIKTILKPEEHRILQKKLKELTHIKSLFENPYKMPLSYTQLFFEFLERGAGLSTNVITSTFIEGSLDKRKFERILNELQNEFDVFFFKTKKWLPYAEKRPLKKLKLETYRFASELSMDEQLDEIYHKLLYLDFRQLKQNIYACLVPLSEKKALLHLVMSHQTSDEKSNVLIWNYIKSKYFKNRLPPYLPFRSYMYSERSYYSGLDSKLQKNFIKEYGDLNPGRMKNEFIETNKTIKRVVYYTLDRQTLKALQHFAYNNDFMMEELFISALIQAIKPFCSNSETLIQILSQPVFNKDFLRILGPCFNDRMFGLHHANLQTEALRQQVREANRNSINCGNYPFVAALGWLYYHKYPFLSFCIGKLLRCISKAFKYVAISPAIANAIAGLISVRFRGKRNNELFMLTINFHNELTDHLPSVPSSNQDVSFSSYKSPLNQLTKNYLNLHMDVTQDQRLVIYLTSFCKEEVDREIMESMLKILYEIR